MKLERKLHLRMRDPRGRRVVSVLVGGRHGMEVDLAPGGRAETRLLQEAADRLRQRVAGNPRSIDRSVALSTLQRNARLDV